MRNWRRLFVLLCAGLLIFAASQFNWQNVALSIAGQFADKTGQSAGLATVLDSSSVVVPAGDFVMGSDDGAEHEKPAHRVYLDAFAIDRYEVTNAQYQRFLRETNQVGPPYWNGNAFPLGQALHPVVGIGWADADAYCRWAGKRLPTEAEWEKACRGADARVYPWGNAWDSTRANVSAIASGADTAAWEQAWAHLQTGTAQLGIPALHQVGSYPDGASPYGIFDLAGNASEWVQDWYNWSDYSKLPTRNPLGQGPPWNHSVRGSAWFEPYGSDENARQSSRCAARSSSHASNDPRIGFRCARAAR